jgi:hypothetical protein
MPRTKSARPHLEIVAVRLDVETIARLDALRPLYVLPGRGATHSDVLRAVILAGLEIEERRAARSLSETMVDKGGGVMQTEGWT